MWCAMSNLVEVGRIGELEDGTMKEVVIQGNRIVLARSGDRYYAVDGRCPHMGGKFFGLQVCEAAEPIIRISR